MTDRSTPAALVSGPRHAPVTSGTTLRHGLVASVVIHALGIAYALAGFAPVPPRDLAAVDPAVGNATVDVEIAPPPPKLEALPAEVAAAAAPAPAKQRASSNPPTSADDGHAVAGARDAGVDAPDARPRKPRRVRPTPDAGPVVATSDGGAGDDSGSTDAAAGDAGAAAAIANAEAGGGLESNPAGYGSGADAGIGDHAVAQIVPTDAAGATETRAVDAAMSAALDNPGSSDAALTTFTGTAANLFAYLPPGQVVTALVRFDRLRGTEWAAAAESLLAPMPDYRALFGRRGVKISNNIDMLTISSSQPRDATATTLVMKTQLSRAKVRALLANPAAPIDWSASDGGLVGKRGPVIDNPGSAGVRSTPGQGVRSWIDNPGSAGVRSTPGQGVRSWIDRRVLLSPWRQWYLLAAPTDLSGLLAPAKGELDTVEANAKLPPWLSSIRAIESESGTEKRGPALVVTLGKPRSASGASNPNSSRVAVPSVGFGVSSLPMPVTASIAMELVNQGWLVRGTMRFATEGEASEFVRSVRGIQRRILDSVVLSAIVARQHGHNALRGLSLMQSGTGVSYATSLSIADARAVLAATATRLFEYFEPR